MAIVQPLAPPWHDVCKGVDDIFLAIVFHPTQRVPVERKQKAFGEEAGLSPTSMSGSSDLACKRIEPARFFGIQHVICLDVSRSKHAC